VRVILFVLFDARATEADEADFWRGGTAHLKPRAQSVGAQGAALIKKCAILSAVRGIGQSRAVESAGIAGC